MPALVDLIILLALCKKKKKDSTARTQGDFSLIKAMRV